ncbi:MAG: hypothetical protein H3C41_06565 [Bacteroidales bacterium]|nr:hypothetical protein [Bacteroidales bacterium]
MKPSFRRFKKRMFRSQTIRFITLLLIILFVACKPETPDYEKRFTYSYMEEIANPPDDFLILFNNQPVGQKIAKITFNSDAVWHLERIGDLRGTVTIKKNLNYHNLNMSDTLGLYGGFQYEVVLSNVPYGESQDVYVGFKKLNSDFGSFEPKF